MDEGEVERRITLPRTVDELEDPKLRSIYTSRPRSIRAILAPRPFCPADSRTGSNFVPSVISSFRSSRDLCPQQTANSPNIDIDESESQKPETDEQWMNESLRVINNQVAI
ncbi:predicted protein [Histoplasma capsulatum H143]|uniref:Uncharacterized protein n=1 Tax=Ajellomyces capsulatus (strain H143) TaxID=544712 RepID=C6HQB3_AJECH|nr:predicted protein [Histoplasma capsulatum H143]